MKELDIRLVLVLVLVLVAMSVSSTSTHSLTSSTRKGFKLHTGKVWSDDQCDLIQFYASTNLDDCIQECSYYPSCTAFNYIGSGCVLRECPLPIPEPENGDVDYFNGYSLDEDNTADQSDTISVSNSHQNRVSQNALHTTSAPNSQLVKVGSTNKPISGEPIIQPITVSPINQPIPVTPIIKPIAAYPANRISEVVDPIREFETVLEKEDKGNVNNTLLEAPTYQPIPVAPIIQPITLSPINQPILVTPIIKPIAVYPANRISEVVDPIREFETALEKGDKGNVNNTLVEAPTNQPIPVAPIIQPITLSPINQPIPVTPIIKPIAVYPANRTSKAVDPIREFDTVAEKEDQSNVNNALVEALHAAAKANLPDVLNALLNAGFDKNAKNDKGMTPLYIASWFGSLPVVQKLIEHDVDVNIQANNGSTPLMVATWKGNINIVKALLDANADTELSNLNGETALHNTAAFNRPNIARLLLQKGADTMKQDKWGLTPEELAIEQGSHLVADIIRDFSSTSNTNQQTIISSGQSSTSASVSESYVVTSNHSTSSQSSTSTSVSDSTLVTPSNQPTTVINFDEHKLWIAAERGDLTLVNNSIESGTNLNWKNPSQNYSTALHAASNANYTEIVSALIEAGAEKDIVNDKGMTPLYLASWHGNTDVVNKLIDYEVDVDIQANNGSTPLMVATWQGHLDIVKALLGANANTSLMNLNNETALHNAAAFDRPNIASLLLQDGADTSKEDKWGLTPEDLAKEQKNHEVDSIIKDFSSIPYRTANDKAEEI